MPKSYGWDVVAHKILETALSRHFIVRKSVLVNGVRRREAAEDETIPGPAQR